MRELKARTSELLRMVREEGRTVEITHRGQVVARIEPYGDELPEREIEAYWADVDRFAAEVAAKWQGSHSAVEAIREQRRDL